MKTSKKLTYNKFYSYLSGHIAYQKYVEYNNTQLYCMQNTFMDYYYVFFL